MPGDEKPIPDGPHAGQLSIGVDIGGTNIRVAAYRDLVVRRRERAQEAAIPDPVCAHREPVGQSREPEAVAARLAAIIDALVTESGASERDLVPVGIGIAGILNGSGGMVAQSPHLGWRQVPFGDLVQQRLSESRPIAVHNDANAITYGEYAFGAGVGARDILGVYVGTGIGSGIIAEGRLIAGATNSAGEVGHFKVTWGDDAMPCACGRRGCAETYVGGEYLQARMRRDLGDGAGSSSRVDSAAVRLAGGDPFAVHPGHLDLAAAQGDRYALDLYAEIAPPLAIAVGNALNLLNPARLILGGGVLSRAPILRQHVVAALEIAVMPAILAPITVVDAALGDDAGVLGSALLAAESPGQ